MINLNNAKMGAKLKMEARQAGKQFRCKGIYSFVPFCLSSPSIRSPPRMVEFTAAPKLWRSSRRRLELRYYVLAFYLGIPMPFFFPCFATASSAPTDNFVVVLWLMSLFDVDHIAVVVSSVNSVLVGESNKYTEWWIKEKYINYRACVRSLINAVTRM